MNLKQQALTQARLRIESGDDTYICDALGMSEHARPEHVTELGAYINQEIDGEFSLTYWLEAQMPDKTLTSDTMRLARLAWIDKMIEIHE